MNFKPLSTRPSLAREWHAERNGVLRPADVHIGSNLKVWWRCRRDPRHERQAVVGKRSALGRGCPVCAGRVVGPRGENSLLVEAGPVARQWHPTKNGALRPVDVLAGSHQYAWWKCPRGPDHEWRAQVKKRVRAGRGCPFCSGNRASITNSLAARRPAIAKQWHPTRNGALTARDVTPHAHRVVWWQCREAEHEWRISVHNRTGPNCPLCLHRRTAPEDSLPAVLPRLAKQWHPTRNGNLRARDLVVGSNRRIWWKYPKGPDHEWSTTLVQRGVEGTGCPFCSRRRLSVTNHLGALFPDVARQWHPSRNGALRPDKLMPQSKRQVWWKCEVADDHEWRAGLLPDASRSRLSVLRRPQAVRHEFSRRALSAHRRLLASGQERRAHIAWYFSPCDLAHLVAVRPRSRVARNTHSARKEAGRLSALPAGAPQEISTEAPHARAHSHGLRLKARLLDEAIQQRCPPAESGVLVTSCQTLISTSIALSGPGRSLRLPLSTLRARHLACCQGRSDHWYEAALRQMT